MKRTVLANGEVLKECAKGHIWLADISFCPYCHCSPEARVHGMEQAREIEKLRKEKKRENP